MIHINLDKCCDKAIKNNLWLNYPNKTDTLVTKKGLIPQEHVYYELIQAINLRHKPGAAFCSGQ
tara:strand:+ start:2193 stop:2384 length:192 start_codon:yes stop_codon:yes gene_type:complete